MADQHASPLNQGREARRWGEDRTSNPYRKMLKKGGTWGELQFPLSDHLWATGWDEADDAVRAEEQAA